MTLKFVIILQNLIKAYHRKSVKSKYDRKLTELDVETTRIRSLVNGVLTKKISPYVKLTVLMNNNSMTNSPTNSMKIITSNDPMTIDKDQVIDPNINTSHTIRIE